MSTTTLLDRRAMCSSRLLRERVSQALSEAGSSANLSAVVTGLVATLDKVRDINDEEIVAYIATLGGSANDTGTDTGTDT